MREHPDNSISFMVWGRYALFTDPFSKTGGDKFSYPVPTYEALKGIMKSIFWKPTIIWNVLRVRILNPIQMESKSICSLKMNGTKSLAYCTYLVDPAYQVEVQFEWNLNRPEFEADRISGKYYTVSRRMIEKGGRRDIFLGTRECQGYVKPCVFGDGAGFYDNTGVCMDFGIMFHGFDYPDETGIEEFRSRFWKPIMNNGIISFIPPQKCTLIRRIRKMKASKQISSGLEEESLKYGMD